MLIAPSMHAAPSKPGLFSPSTHPCQCSLPQWGEHIHLGTYTDEERKRGAFKKDFKRAKYDFCDDMLRFSGSVNPSSILDVGCGFGGTSRHLAKLFPSAHVNGGCYPNAAKMPP